MLKGRATHPDFGKLFKGGIIEVTDSGGITPLAFARLVDHFGTQMRLRVPDSEAVVLVLDTGGNAAPHLSVEATLAFERHNIRPFYLPAYTTKILMPLDQMPNNEADRLWHAGRREQEGGLTAFAALALAEPSVDACAVFLEACAFS